MNPYRKRQKNNRRRAYKRGVRYLDAMDRALKLSGNWDGWRTKRSRRVTESIGANMDQGWLAPGYSARMSKTLKPRQEFGWLAPLPPGFSGTGRA